MRSSQSWNSPTGQTIWSRPTPGGCGGRLELAQALVHEPAVLFLDEPTIGLDVAARKKIWEHIRELRKNGMTIFVTTHYMDEADQFCDRVGIISNGKIVALGHAGRTQSPADERCDHGTDRRARSSPGD